MVIKIMTHNAYWFQGRPSLWGEERQTAHPKIFEALVRLYGRLEPDVLCLQEVPSADLFTIVKARLGMHGICVPGGSIAAYGGAILLRDLRAKFQDYSNIMIESAQVFERICIFAQIKLAHKNLNLVNVHLASNRYAPSNNGEETRLAEIALLVEIRPKPDLIIGDFNTTPDSVVSRCMKESGYIDCGSPYANQPTSGNRRIDYVWISEESYKYLTDYRVVSGQRFHLQEGNTSIALSDHRPIIVKLDLGVD